MIDVSKLRPYQVPHVAKLLRGLVGRKAALDASDTGTGKTYCALAVCKALGLAPRVICPVALVPTWEDVGKLMGLDVEAIGYEKARSIRWTRGQEDAWKSAKAEAANGPEQSARFAEWNGMRERAIASLGEDMGDKARAARLVASGHSVGLYGSEVAHGKGSYWKWHDDIAFGIFDEVQRCTGLSTLNSKLLKAGKRQWAYLLCLSATAADSILDFNALGFALGIHTGKDFKNWLLKRGCKPDIFGGFPTMPEDKAEAIMGRLHREIFADRGSRMRRSEIPSFPKTQIDIKCLGTDEEAAAIAKEAAEAAENDLGTWQHSMQELELRAVPQVIELAQCYHETSRVVIFVNYVATLDKLVRELPGLTGYIDGSQTGPGGARERQQFIKQFQANCLNNLVVNTQAGDVGINLHDPTGQVDRTALIFSNFSGKTLAQVLGRVHRDGGAFSQQFLLAYKGTFQEQAILTALGKLDKISLLNDNEVFGFLHP